MAQARLVLTSTPGTKALGRRGDHDRYSMTFQFANHGDRPVMDVQVEAWDGGQSLDERARWGLQNRIVQPGADIGPWVMSDIDIETANFSVRAWRYRWTDADGRQWCVDQPQQREPLPYTGQPPRQYTGRPSPG